MKVNKSDTITSLSLVGKHTEADVKSSLRVIICSARVVKSPFVCQTRALSPEKRLQSSALTWLSSLVLVWYSSL